MSMILTSEGVYRPLSPRIYLKAPDDDGRYRGPWVTLGNHLVTPDFKLSVELMGQYRDGIITKDDFIHNPVWVRKLDVKNGVK